MGIILWLTFWGHPVGCDPLDIRCEKTKYMATSKCCQIVNTCCETNEHTATVWRQVFCSCRSEAVEQPSS